MSRFLLSAVVGVLGLLVPLRDCMYSQELLPPAPRIAPKDDSPAPNPAQVPPSQLPTADVLQRGESLAEILGHGAAKLEPAELVGMAAGSKTAVLTLEQVYALALIHARNPVRLPAIARAGLVDPAVLTEAAKQAGVRHFDRFHHDFLAAEFHDPAPAFLAAIRHRQAVDSARDQVAAITNMRQLFDELLHGGASGLSSLHLDLVDQFLLLSRQNLDTELERYRSAVDVLKVSIGLPPSTAIVVDEQMLEPFRNGFSNVDAWQHSPKRDLAALSKLHSRLPRLVDIAISGRSVAQIADGRIPEVEFLQVCAEAAAKERGIPKDEMAAQDGRHTLDLRIRKLARSLILTHKNYEVQRRGLELAAREADQWLEQIVSPPAAGTGVLAQTANSMLQITGVLQAKSRLYHGRFELVSQWLRFKEQTLALYRELGIMPFDNWEAFDRSFVPHTDTNETGR
jgi:hypothetical protein